jgi:hypothetical protein
MSNVLNVESVDKQLIRTRMIVLVELDRLVVLLLRVREQ